MGEDVQHCVHCGVELQQVPYALGPKWMHSPYPHNWRDCYWHCRRTVATPPTTVDPVQLELT